VDPRTGVGLVCKCLCTRLALASAGYTRPAITGTYLLSRRSAEHLEILMCTRFNHCQQKSGPHKNVAHDTLRDFTVLKGDVVAMLQISSLMGLQQ
jgi:hypothetical protein